MDITNIVLSAFLAFGQPVTNSREVVRYGGVQAIHADGCLTFRMSEPVRTERTEAGARHIGKGTDHLVGVRKVTVSSYFAI